MGLEYRNEHGVLAREITFFYDKNVLVVEEHHDRPGHAQQCHTCVQEPRIEEDSRD